MTYKDRGLLLYTEAVLLETLRLANIAPVGLPHSLDKQMNIDGKVSAQPAGFCKALSHAQLTRHLLWILSRI